jgi:hypothetical protein
MAAVVAKARYCEGYQARVSRNIGVVILEPTDHGPAHLTRSRAGTGRSEGP